MIYEFRTYQIEPGTAGSYGERVAEKIEKRVEYSPLMGYWYSELGTLNEVLHIWPYKDSNERAEIRQKVVDDGICLLYTSPSPRDPKTSRMPSSA